MVARLQYSTDDMRVTQLNEHIMREIDAGNVDYLGFGNLNESTARITIDSPDFVQLWERYKEDMEHDAAWGGNTEAIALANLYDVNVSLWGHNTERSVATHIATHLQTPPAPRTVYLLNTDNIHYEATNLPIATFPQIADLSSRQGRPNVARSQAAASALMDQQSDQHPPFPPMSPAHVPLTTGAVTGSALVTLFAYPPQEVLYFPSFNFLFASFDLPFYFSGSCSCSTCLRLTSNWQPCPSATACDLPFPNGLHSHQPVSCLTGGN
jgi:hypothetical protein